MRCSLFALSFAYFATADTDVLPTFPTEYEAVIQMSMPYIGLEMPIRVLTSSTTQRMEYWDGLQIDQYNAKGITNYIFNNSQRVCLFRSSSDGPRRQLEDEPWRPVPFTPDLSQYTAAGIEIIHGITCKKFTLDVPRSKDGIMDDHITFYWSQVLQKPVRWHIHARHPSFHSHTDEYIFDYLSFEPKPPHEDAFDLPAECVSHRAAVAIDVSIQLSAFMNAAHSMRALPNAADLDSALFSTFVKQYGKSYTPSESKRRSQIFENNVRLVKEMNIKHAGKATFRGNQFLDMTAKEVLTFKGGKGVGNSRRSRLPDDSRLVRVHQRTSQKLPKEWDWRTARPGVVGPVKDQAMCGSCWTYGLIEPIESMLAIQTGRPLVVLPEQFILDCTWRSSGASGGNNGCGGGNSDLGGFEVVRKFGGVIPTAAAYGSYLSVNGFCKDTRLMEVGAKITGFVDIQERDEQSILDALANKGPINVNIQVPEEMLFYDSGVLNVDSCRHNDTEIDHSVVATGYGTAVDGTEYYWVRNSWSTYWGDQGYIKIARGANDCCVACNAGYPEIAHSEVDAVAPVVV